MNHLGPRSYLSSYGRNRGRTLSAYQQRLVNELLPTLQPNPRTLSHESRNIALEIGFGGGEHLLAQAMHRPDTLFVGCEPFINGVAKCLVGIAQQRLTNIHIFTHDARELIEALPDRCVNEVFILFPDPWPKVRHHKRRLVNARTLDMLARIHQPGGRLMIATDHVDYSVWILALLQHHPGYRWTATRSRDWNLPPTDWTITKYQRKTSAEGRTPVFLECVRTLPT